MKITSYVLVLIFTVSLWHYIKHRTISYTTWRLYQLWLLSVRAQTSRQASNQWNANQAGYPGHQSYLEAQVWDDRGKAVGSQQWHHQLFQALVRFVVLQRKTDIKSWMLHAPAAQTLRLLFFLSRRNTDLLNAGESCQSLFMSKNKIMCWGLECDVPRPTHAEILTGFVCECVRTSINNQKRSKSCCMSWCSSTEPPPSRIPSRKFISTSSTR